MGPRSNHAGEYNNGAHTENNLCLASDYGFTLYENSDCILFSSRERLFTCRTHLHYPKGDCERRINQAFADTGYERHYGDKLYRDCSFALTIVQEVTHNYCKNYDVEKLSFLMRMMLLRMDQVDKKLTDLDNASQGFESYHCVDTNRNGNRFVFHGNNTVKNNNHCFVGNSSS